MAAQALAHAETLSADVLSRAEERGVESLRDMASAADALRYRLLKRQGRPVDPRDVASDLAGRMSRLGTDSRAQGQHVYQELVLAAQSSALTPALALGLCRLQLLVPAQMRLFKWKARRALKKMEESSFSILTRRGRTRRLLKTALPLAGLLGATVACSLVNKEGTSGGSDFALTPAPELSKPKSAVPSPLRRDAPWNYILPVDHGVRADRSGQGHFRAPRFHGEHNGLDLLAPVGTPVFSPCSGKAMSGVSRSFGRWVHVICPVPDEFAQKGRPHPWASFFYAHLEKADLPYNTWVSVSGAQAVGKVGKSGNARGPNVQPHLHFEMIVQKNRRAAMDERHLGKDQSSVSAAEHFASKLATECMKPFGFQAKTQLLRRARRIDPFIALTCLSEQKPNFIKAPSPLTDHSKAWTQFYSAKDFNVNLGVEDARTAKR